MYKHLSNRKEYTYFIENYLFKMDCRSKQLMEDDVLETKNISKTNT